MTDLYSADLILLKLSRKSTTCNHFSGSIPLQYITIFIKHTSTHVLKIHRKQNQILARIPRKYQDVKSQSSTLSYMSLETFLIPIIWNLKDFRPETG